MRDNVESGALEPRALFAAAAADRGTDFVGAAATGQGRVRVRFLRQRGEAIASTPLFSDDAGGRALDGSLPAKFNAHHLLHGGYCLTVAGGRIDINHAIDVVDLTEEEFIAWINDFAEKAANGVNWFAKEQAERAAREEAKRNAWRGGSLTL